MTVHKTGIQMGEVTRIRWLIGLVTQAVQFNSFYRYSRNFCSCYILEYLAPVEFYRSLNWVHILLTAFVCTWESSLNLNSYTLNLISCSMITPWPVVTPSSILLTPLSHCACILAKENSVELKKYFYLNIFFTFLKSCMSEIMWLVIV